MDDNNYNTNNDNQNNGEIRKTVYVNTNPIVWIIVIIFIFVTLGIFVFDAIIFNKIKDNYSEMMNQYESTSTTMSSEIVSADASRKENDAFILGELIDSHVLQFNKDYLTDYNFKFVYFVYHANDYMSIDETNVNGETETGRRRFNLNEFKSFYLRFIGEDFDINKLNKDKFYKASEFPTIVGDYIYTTIYSGYVEKPVVYVSTSRFSDGTFMDTFNYCELKGDTNYVIGKVYVKYTIDPKGFVTYKSIIVKK